METPLETPTAAAEEVLTTAETWSRAGRRVALATVIKTWGSSPLPIGSQLAVDEDCNFVGSVSGGCIEGAVIEQALEIMNDGRPRLLKFGVTNERAWEVGLSCGGEMEVYVEVLS